MEKLTLAKLKELGKEKGIRGYSTWNSKNREQAIALLKQAGVEEKVDVSPDVSQPKKKSNDIDNMSITDLKQYAKSLGIAGVTKYRKASIQELLTKVRLAESGIEKDTPSIVVSVSDEIDISEMNITELKKIAVKFGIPKISTYRKNTIEMLRQLVLEKMNTPPTRISKSPIRVSKPPTRVSKPPTRVSKSPTRVSKSPTRVSKSPTIVPQPSQPSSPDDVAIPLYDLESDQVVVNIEPMMKSVDQIVAMATNMKNTELKPQFDELSKLIEECLLLA